MHAADINNPSLDLDNYLSWAALLTDEFNSQTVAEKEAGLEPTGFLIYKNEIGFYKSQKGFSSKPVLTSVLLPAALQGHPRDFS